jgi:hypothetical protein
MQEPSATQPLTGDPEITLYYHDMKENFGIRTVNSGGLSFQVQLQEGDKWVISWDPTPKFHNVLSQKCSGNLVFVNGSIYSEDPITTARNLVAAITSTKGKGRLITSVTGSGNSMSVVNCGDYVFSM